MVAWDPQQYLRFERERTQACIDLARRVELSSPQRVVDLGCGPGTSTAILRARWPGAQLTGVDSSPEMLAKARPTDPTVEWVLGDIQEWTPRVLPDLVFSNAAFQWIPDHPGLLRRLWSIVGPGGALAFQVPAGGEERSRWVGALASLLKGSEWRRIVPGDRTGENVLHASDYYDVLSESARRVDLWDTEYLHVLPNATAIVEWLTGTALRPILSQLEDDGVRRRFLAEYAERIRETYPTRRDGRILFPFRRRFVVAYRG